MAEKHFISGAPEKDRLLGELALNGTEDHRAGDCPEPEDLAELLDGNCDRFRREALLFHLDSCESCFQEWLELSRILKARRKWTNRVVTIVSRKRVLAAAGSAFAIAASIVVFMSTPFYQDNRPLKYQVDKERIEDVQAPDSALKEMIEPEEREIGTSFSDVKMEETTEHSGVPVSPPPKHLKSRASAPVEEKSTVHRLREKPVQDDAVNQARKPSLETALPAPLLKEENEQLHEGGIQIGGSLADADSGVLDEYNDFLVMVERFCRGDPAEDKQEVLLTQARNLRQRGAAGDRQRQAAIERVVKLLEEDIPYQELCERLAAILCFKEAQACEKNSSDT